MSHEDAAEKISADGHPAVFQGQYIPFLEIENRPCTAVYWRTRHRHPLIK
jgi:hypothetical protein